MNFTEEDFAQIARIQVAVAAAIRPFAHNTAAGLAVMALARNLRVLVERHPPEVRAALIDAIGMYLNHDGPDDVVVPFSITQGGIVRP